MIAELFVEASQLMYHYTFGLDYNVKKDYPKVRMTLREELLD